MACLRFIFVSSMFLYVWHWTASTHECVMQKYETIIIDIINSGLETEQPIRVHFYHLTWWTWCLAPPLAVSRYPMQSWNLLQRLFLVSENCILFWWTCCLLPPLVAWTECRLHNVYFSFKALEMIMEYWSKHWRNAYMYITVTVWTL